MEAAYGESGAEKCTGLISIGEISPPVASERRIESVRSPAEMGLRGIAGIDFLRSARVRSEVKYVFPTPVSVPVIKIPFMSQVLV
jgi:hypothetical protein